MTDVPKRTQAVEYRYTNAKLRRLSRIAYLANKYDITIEQAELKLKEIKRLDNCNRNKSRQHYEYVYKRDGRICRLCGATEDLTIDHIKPLKSGGSMAASNLQVLCKECHDRKEKEWTAKF